MTPEEFAQAIQEFKAIFKDEYGIELSNEEATTNAQSVLQLFECLIQETQKGVK